MYRNFTTQITLNSSIVRLSSPLTNGVPPKEVVLSFESAMAMDRSDVLRKGFAEKILLESGYACVSFLCNEPHWYRPKDVQDFIQSDYLRKFLGRYDKVHTYGSSMGGFAALAFADVVGADNAIAMAPITSLSVDSAPWETRFRNGAKRNWNTPFNDGVKSISTPKSIWLIYDPLSPDMPHVDRLREHVGSRLREVPWPNAGHGIGAKLLQKGALKTITTMCLTDTTAMPATTYLSDIDLVNRNGQSSGASGSTDDTENGFLKKPATHDPAKSSVVAADRPQFFHRLRAKLIRR